jgi:hypothetical protein
MTGGELTLASDGLLSKWGFNDGGLPDDLLDWLEAETGQARWESWHAVLRRLVADFLVPALDQGVELAFITTAHNPVRAGKVDGRDAEDLWYGSGLLSPGSVRVPFPVVLRYLREEGD